MNSLEFENITFNLKRKELAIHGSHYMHQKMMKKQEKINS